MKTNLEINNKSFLSNWIRGLSRLIFLTCVFSPNDIKPFKLKYGDLLCWNFNKCLHGNHINKTGLTRVSFDFRIIPCRKYDGFGNNTYTTFKLDFIEDESEHGDITRLNRPTSFYGRKWDTSPEGYYSFCENTK